MMDESNDKEIQRLSISDEDSQVNKSLFQAQKIEE